MTEGFWRGRILPELAAGLEAAEKFAGFPADILRARLEDALVGMRLPLVLCHGDYWPGNILFDKAGGRATGVVDWDRPLADFLPLVDAFHALLYSEKEAGRRKLPDIVGEALSRDACTAELTLYLNQIGFRPGTRQWRALLVVYWLLYVSARVARPNPNAWQPKWLRENVTPASAWVGEALRG